MSVFITAEIGINHNGDLQLAKKLIDTAVIAGCDAVKFQKRTVDKVYTQEYLASPRKSPWGETQRAQKEGLEFGKEEYDEIDRYCKEKGIEWFASAWDVDSQIFLRQYDLKYNKVASAMLTNDELLQEIASEGKYTFIATGMSTLDEIDHAVDIFEQFQDEFNATHDDIYLKIDSPNDAMTILKTRFIREDNPDIIGIGGDINYSNFLDADMLMDISDFEGLNDIKEKYLEMNKDLEYVPKDGVYAVPYMANAAGILFNRDMFEEHGWEVPTTWTEFIRPLAHIDFVAGNRNQCPGRGSIIIDKYPYRFP